MRGFFAGVDAGSSWAKAVVVDETGRVMGRAVLPTGLDLRAAGDAVLESACSEAGVRPEALSATVSTGYGRDDVAQSDRTRSEILCLAKGAYSIAPRAMAVVDIGGQDSKIVFLDEAGNRADYKMNRKCAAGTGSFLEIVAMRLGTPLDQLAPLAQRTAECAPLSSFCSVFAATEVLDLLRKGYTLEAIARGVYRSVAQRVVDMGLGAGPVALAGGVVEHHPVLAQVLREVTGMQVEILEHPQHVGALGAAILASEGAR
jgi:predicted CoA-substrate-specific enzyme activase